MKKKDLTVFEQIKTEGATGDLAEKVDYLNSEIERLQQHLNNSLKELSDWRRRYNELEVIRNQEIEGLRDQFNTVKKTQIVRFLLIAIT